MTAPYDNDYGSPDMYEQGKVEEPTREEVIAWLESVSAEWPNRSPAAEYSCFKEVALFRHAARLLREPPPEAAGLQAEVARLRERHFAMLDALSRCKSEAVRALADAPNPSPMRRLAGDWLAALEPAIEIVLDLTRAGPSSPVPSAPQTQEET